jgi:hypothetical protein
VLFRSIKPIRKARDEKDMPGAFDRLERLERRLEMLENLYRQTNNLLIAKCVEIEELKNVIRKDLC